MKTILLTAVFLQLTAAQAQSNVTVKKCYAEVQNEVLNYIQQNVKNLDRATVNVLEFVGTAETYPTTDTYKVAAEVVTEKYTLINTMQFSVTLTGTKTCADAQVGIIQH